MATCLYQLTPNYKINIHKIIKRVSGIPTVFIFNFFSYLITILNIWWLGHFPPFKYWTSPVFGSWLYFLVHTKLKLTVKQSVNNILLICQALTYFSSNPQASNTFAQYRKMCDWKTKNINSFSKTTVLKKQNYYILICRLLCVSRYQKKCMKSTQIQVLDHIMKSMYVTCRS